LGIPIFVAATTVLCLIEQDEGQHKFGQPGGLHLASEFQLCLQFFITNAFALDMTKV